MSKKYRVFLNGKKRSDLRRLVNTGADKARKLTRARILLLADESPRGPSKKDKDIMEALDVCARTVAITRQRFTEGDIQGALNEKPRSGRPLTNTDTVIIYPSGKASLGALGILGSTLNIWYPSSWTYLL